MLFRAVVRHMKVFMQLRARAGRKGREGEDGSGGEKGTVLSERAVSGPFLIFIPVDCPGVGVVPKEVTLYSN